MKINILYFIFFLFLSGSFAQRPLEIFVDFPPPYAQHISAYDISSGKYSITIFNHTTVPQTINFRAQLHGLDNNRNILLEESVKPSKGIVIPPQVFFPISQEILEEAYSGLSKEDIIIENIDLLSGEVPPGRYELCIIAYDFETSIQLSIGCSLQFDVENSNNLSIVFPENNSIHDPNMPLNFLWEVTGFSRPLDLTYTLEIIDITDSGLNDFESQFSQIEPKFFAINGLQTVQYSWGFMPIPEPDSFKVGHQYAVRVKMTDSQGNLSSDNGNYSPIHTFYYGENNQNEGNEEQEIPEDCESRCNVAMPSNNALGSFEGKNEITCGYFKIKNLIVDENTGNGTGTTTLNFLNNINVLVKLESVKINSDGKVIEGSIYAIPDPNDVNSIGDLITEFGLDRINEVIPGATNSAIGQIPADKQNQIGDAIRNSHMIYALLSAGKETVGLPLGIDQSFDGGQVTLGITGLELYPSGAKCKVIAGIKLNIGNRMQWFLSVGDSICIAPNGFGGEYRISLGADLPINAEDQNEFDIIFKGSLNETDARCYFEMNCRGLKKIGIHGEIGIPRDILLPVNDQAKAIEGKVHSKFHFEMNLINQAGSNQRTDGGVQLLVGLELPRCQINGMDGWAMSIENAWLDMSDSINPNSLSFPSGYPAEKKQQFKGLYIEKIIMDIPVEFVKDRSKKIQIKDAIIDPQLYVNASVKDILKIDAGGALAGFAFSIDEFAMNIKASQLEDVSLKGGISLPIQKPGEFMPYEAKFAFDNGGKNPVLGFSINPSSGFQIPMFIADATLKPNSYLVATLDPSQPEGKKINVKFGIFGRIDIDSDKLKEMLPVDVALPDLPAGLKLPGLEFNLVYDTKVTNGFIKDSCTFGFASPSKTISGLPFNITELGLDFGGMSSNGEVEIGLKCDIGVTLIDGPSDIAAATEFTIWSKFNPTAQGFNKISFDRLSINGIHVDANMNGITIKGQIEFYSIETNGQKDRGVKGDVTVGLPIGVLMIEAQFGVKGSPTTEDIFAFNENYFAYFRLAGTLMFRPGIPLGVAPYQLPFDLYGFGGGIAYNMKLDNAPANTGSDISGFKPRYIPAYNNFELKASVVLGNTIDPTPMNGMVTFSAAIDLDKGLVSLGVAGDLYMMTPLTDWGNPKVYARTTLNLNFYPRLELVGSFLAFVKIKPSEEISIVGKMNGQPEGVMITGSMRLSGEENYIRFGAPRMNLVDPEPRGRLQLNAVVMNKGLVLNEYLYLMAGDGVPVGLPPLPQGAQDIFEELRINVRPPSFSNTSIGSSGMGFALGTQIDIKVNLGLPHFEDLIKFNFDGYAGFDVNMSKYTNVKCSNNNGEEIGLNSYYALGQAYIALKVNTTIDPPAFDPIQYNGMIGAYVQAGFPNPFYIQGQVGLRIEMPELFAGGDAGMAGLVEIINSAEVGAKASYIDGEEKIDDVPNNQERFNLSFEFLLGKKCEIESAPLQMNDLPPMFANSNPEDHEENVGLDKIIELEFNYITGENNFKTIGADMKPIDNKYTFEVTSVELFQGGKSILKKEKLRAADKKATFSIPEFFIPNVDYKLHIVLKLFKNGNLVKTESKDIHFRTETKPARLDSYVRETMPRKYNYYIQGNNKKGLIFFTKDISSIFPVGTKDKSEYSYFVILKTADQDLDSLEMKYSTTGADGANFSYNLPSLELKKSYSLEFYQRIIIHSNKDFIRINKIYDYNFGTSKYMSLEEKINSIEFKKRVDDVLYFTIGEPLEDMEINQSNHSDIVFAESMHNAYHQNFRTNYSKLTQIIPDFQNIRYTKTSLSNNDRSGDKVNFVYNSLINNSSSDNTVKKSNDSNKLKMRNPTLGQGDRDANFTFSIQSDLQQNHFAMRDRYYQFLLAQQGINVADHMQENGTTWHWRQLDVNYKESIYQLNIFKKNSSEPIKTITYLNTQE